MDEKESLSPYEVGVPRGMYPEVPQKDAVREVAAALGRSVPQAGRAEGESHRRRASAARSRAHEGRHSAEVRSVARDWVYQGEERDSLGAGVWGEEAELHGPAFLGARVLRVHGGRDETVIRDYIRNQAQEDKRLDRMNLWC